MIYEVLNKSFKDFLEQSYNMQHMARHIFDSIRLDSIGDLERAIIIDGGLNKYIDSHPHYLGDVSVAMSGSHMHPTEEFLLEYFGKESKELEVKRELDLEGNYVLKDKVKIEGFNGNQLELSVLTPVRDNIQIELTPKHSEFLGYGTLPKRQSGELEGTPGFIVNGKKFENGVIEAAPHIHMHYETAKKLGVENGASLYCAVHDSEFNLPHILTDLKVKTGPFAQTQVHLDLDRAWENYHLKGRDIRGKLFKFG